MDLKKKLILEDLEEPVSTPVPVEPATLQLSDAEKDNMNTGIVTDILNKSLELFNLVNGEITVDLLEPELKELLDNIAGDIAIIIGKLQGCLQIAGNDYLGELMGGAEQDVLGKGDIIEQQTQEETVEEE